MMERTAAVAPGYCPKCGHREERASWTMTAEGWLWGPRCPNDGHELRSTLLDLVGVPYYEPSEVTS